MGCNSSKTIPSVEDSDDEPYEPSKDLFENDTGVINPSAAVADIQPDITTKPEEASKEETPTTSIPITATTTAVPAEEKKQETDAEFLQRMEDEDKASFTAAVNEWRADKAAGKGEAKIIESGGGFGATSTETTDPQVDEKHSEPVSKTEETKVETSAENNDVPVKETKDEVKDDDSKVDVKVEAKEEPKEVAKEEAKEETKEGTKEETKEESTDSKDEDMGFGIAGLLPFAIAQEMIPKDTEW